MATLSGHQRKVVSLQVASDGLTVLSCDPLGFRVWRLSGSEFESVMQGTTSDPVRTRLSPDARFLLSPAQHALQIWELAADETAKRSIAVSSEVADLSWLSRDHQFVVLVQNAGDQVRELIISDGVRDGDLGSLL